MRFFLKIGPNYAKNDLRGTDRLRFEIRGCRQRRAWDRAFEKSDLSQDQVARGDRNHAGDQEGF